MQHIIFVSILAGLVCSQGNYRRRAGHAAVLAGDKLLVSGGLIAYEEGVPVYENKTWIIDLASSWRDAPVTYVSRPTRYTGLEYETLWYDPNKNYVYASGGELSQDGEIPNPGGKIVIPDESIRRFSFDETGDSGIWIEVLGPTARNDFPSNIGRPLMGASAADNQSAYYIGGAISKWTTNKVGNMTKLRNVPGLLQFDFNTEKLTNSSNDGSYFAAKWPQPDQTMSLVGMMTYVPLFGSQGVFIVVGGQSNNTGSVEHGWQEIAVFDPAANTWYYQKAQGDIPETSDWSANIYCSFGVEDSDLKTFDIFVFRDFKGVTDGHTYFILSLPSFTWFATNVVSLPRRNQQTCTATRNRQMIMIGGLDPNQVNGYDPQNWSATPDPWPQGIGVFDMTALEYKDNYDANAEAYESPSTIQTYYNHSDRFPVWDDPALRMMFESTNSVNSTSESSDFPKTKLSTGSIAGIVVGVVVVLLLSCAFFFWYRHRRGRPRFNRAAFMQRETSRPASVNIKLTDLPHGQADAPPAYTKKPTSEMPDRGYVPEQDATWFNGTLSANPTGASVATSERS